MKIKIICPVRKGTPQEVTDYVAMLEHQGHKVHFPPRDTNQNDVTGVNICLNHFHAISEADEVHIWYDPTSQGVHFDLGMAFVLGKPLKLINDPPDNSDKSYIKVIKCISGAKE